MEGINFGKVEKMEVELKLDYVDKGTRTYRDQTKTLNIQNSGFLRK